ncbi:MAG: nitroreductase family protein, partial [Pseudomonadota bacterium]
MIPLRVLTLLKWRRDVRQFRQIPLPDDAINKLKEAMDLAPSVGNSRPWRVV